MINAAVFGRLQTGGVTSSIIDLSATGLNRSLAARCGRFPRVLRGLVCLAATRGLGGRVLYISVSGGLGQLYELAFVALARLRGMELCLHHHSFAYLDAPSLLTRILAKAAGASAVHATQSPRMADRLKAVYGVERVVPVSNAVFLLSHKPSVAEPRRRLHTLGFISNIAEEKGVFEFLDLMSAVQDTGLPLRAKLAGPFQDAETERQVRAQLATLPSVEYVGPKYGAEKDAFFASIDAFVFPTRYANETEGIVNHEAMSRAIPVIAYGRGAIPEIVGPECGRVIDLGDPFVPEAMAQIEAWLADPASFAAASGAATRRFAETYAQSERHWQALLGELTGGAAGQVRSRPRRNGGFLIADLITKARKLANLLTVPTWWRALLRYRVAAGVEHTVVLRHLGEVRLVVDIGANRGQFALVARHSLPAAHIVSFEPLAGPAAVYRAVFAEESQATLHEMAVGPEPGEGVIHLSAREDSSSLLPVAAKQNSLFPGTAEIGTQPIRVTRLADQMPGEDIEQPALLKLDVQGFELQALQACEDLLDKFSWVYVECSFAELYAGQAFADAVIAWLRERGFRMVGVYNVSYDSNGQAIQSDFLFEYMLGNTTNA